MKVKDILKIKGNKVYTIVDGSNIIEAINEMTKYSIGVLLVLDKDSQVCGIVSERDVLRFINKQQKDIQSTPINEIYTKKVIFADIDDEIDYIENVMTANKIRHIPIFEKDKLAGIVSIGDVVKHYLKDQKFENKYLQDYIHGKLR